jgi:phosphatidylserine/phosphatidylglycerophosphate/cardiolipin synthase-like enzyme
LLSENNWEEKPSCLGLNKQDGIMETQRCYIGHLFMAIMIAVTLVVTSCAHPHPADISRRLEAPLSATYEVAFSPSRQSEDAILRFIGEAKKSVHVAAYSFTSKGIAQALLDAKARGLDVRVVVDKSQATGKYSAATFLAHHAVSVRVDGEYQLQHQKIMVVDGVSVETGSYNFTASARDRNSENVIIIRNAPELAARYEGNWAKMWRESVVLRKRY